MRKTCNVGVWCSLVVKAGAPYSEASALQTLVLGSSPSLWTFAEYLLTISLPLFALSTANKCYCGLKTFNKKIKQTRLQCKKNEESLFVCDVQRTFFGLNCHSLGVSQMGIQYLFILCQIFTKCHILTPHAQKTCSNKKQVEHCITVHCIENYCVCVRVCTCTCSAAHPEPPSAAAWC